MILSCNKFENQAGVLCIVIKTILFSTALFVYWFASSFTVPLLECSRLILQYF